jgi:hypothetical protein
VKTFVFQTFPRLAAPLLNPRPASVEALFLADALAGLAGVFEKIACRHF